MTLRPTATRRARLAARISGWFYRCLLLAYPRTFRRQYGDEATQLFREACLQSWSEGGMRAVLRRLAAALREVPRHGIADRLDVRGNRRRDRTARGRVLLELVADLRYAARSFRRRPGLVAGIIATLALGIGANTAMFSVIDATLLRPSPYPDADRVLYVRARTVDNGQLRDPTVRELQTWIPRLTSFDRIEARSWKSVLITGPEGGTRTRMLEVTSGYLEALRVRPIAGRLLSGSDAHPDAVLVVVLSETLWRNRYGRRPEIVGRSIDVDGIERVVVGIVPDIPSDTPGLRYGLYGPLPNGESAAGETPARGVAWRRSGVSVAAARAELRAVSGSVDEHGRRLEGELQLPSNVFWDVREFRDPQLALMAGVFLLLVIAGVNVANLLLAGGQSRQAELAVRCALGASRGRLVRLMLAESLLLAAAGCAAGVFVALMSVRLFAALGAGTQLQSRLESIQLDGVVLGYAAAIAIAMGIAFGIVPALRGSAMSVLTSLRDAETRTGTRRRRMSRTFMALEVALSTVLLVAAALVGRAFLQMRLADPGFAADRVLGIRISLPEARYLSEDRRDAFFNDLLARAQRLPGVMAVGLGYGAMPPSDFAAVGALEVEERPGADRVSVSVSFVSPGHFELMGIPLVAGSGFDAGHRPGADSAAETPVVISQSLSRRFWPDRDPIGSGFRITDSRGSRRYRIVGVAGDASGRGLPTPGCVSCQWQIFLPLPSKRLYTEVLLRLADGAPSPVSGLRDAIRQIDPDVPADDSLETAAASLHGFIRLPRFRAALFGGFAALAVTLVALGLLAAVSHAVRQRTREIGIRLALGARPAQMRRMVLRQGMTPAGIGIGTGLLVAFGLTRTMSSYLPGVSPTDGPTFVGCAAFVGAVALIAILVPAVRATRVDPVTTLRAE